jgi:hypothetical protein
VVDVACEPVTAASAGDRIVAAADFDAHRNPPGTWIDFGTVATDGAVKVDREAERLVVFPYPRERPFRVELDIAKLAPGVDSSRLRVRAVAAGTQEDLGPVQFIVEKGRLRLTLGARGAGRYVITWR